MSMTSPIVLNVPIWTLLAGETQGTVFFGDWQIWILKFDVNVWKQILPTGPILSYFPCIFVSLFLIEILVIPIYVYRISDK